MTSRHALNREQPPDALGPESVAQVLRDIRERAPLVHCLTNVVVANFTANVLLAAGASPAMVDAPEEAGMLAGAANSVLINLGTLTSAQAAGMRAAVAGAVDAEVPWVLDPVAIGALPLRTKLAGDLAEQRPAVIRGNASEVAALIGGAGGRGVDSIATPDDVPDAGLEVARRFTTVAAVSGPVDLLTDGARTVRVAAGNEMLTKVTGVGCALGALIAAGCAVTDDPLLAAAAATALVCAAGDAAAGRSTGLGSFAVGLLDAISTLDPREAASAIAAP
jgi:hydroxyethylthiazole kinase